MSYELAFWRNKAGPPSNPKDVYERLLEGISVDDVSEIRADAILARVNEVFNDWSKFGAKTFDGGNRGGFQLSATQYLLVVSCYETQTGTMNSLIDIAHEFGLSFYDPQVDRFFSC